MVSLGKVDGAGEENDTNEKEKYEQAQLAHAGPQRLTEDLEALRVTGQLEDPENPHQPDDPDDGQGCGRRGIIALGQFCSKSDKIGQDSTEINDVHDVLKEGHLTR